MCVRNMGHSAVSYCIHFMVDHLISQWINNTVDLYILCVCGETLSRIKKKKKIKCVETAWHLLRGSLPTRWETFLTPTSDLRTTFSLSASWTPSQRTKTWRWSSLALGPSAAARWSRTTRPRSPCNTPSLSLRKQSTVRTLTSRWTMFWLTTVASTLTSVSPCPSWSTPKKVRDFVTLWTVLIISCFVLHQDSFVRQFNSLWTPLRWKSAKGKGHFWECQQIWLPHDEKHSSPYHTRILLSHDINSLWNVLVNLNLAGYKQTKCSQALWLACSVTWLCFVGKVECLERGKERKKQGRDSEWWEDFWLLLVDW